MNIITQYNQSAVSATEYVYGSAIDLTRTRYSNLPILIKVDVIEGKTTPTFDVNCLWSETSGGTYTPFVTGSGSSKIIAGGTSGALYAAGSYMRQLTTVPYSGVTIPFNSTGWLKLGTKSTNGDFSLSFTVLN